MATWKSVLRTNFTDIDKLAAFLELPPTLHALLLPRSKFILNLPYRLAAKMPKGTLDNPLIRQFVPLKEEQNVTEGFKSDPVEDKTFVRTEKLLQKYSARALVISTSACAMHCRYCFRQNFPYETTRKGFDEELQVIRRDTSIKEIILSGGDPLSLSDEILGEFLHALNGIEHLKRIRFHTRFPIGIPERIDDSLLNLLSLSTKQIWFVIHSNHISEFDQDIFDALKKIQKLGIPVLNQSVLLRGVNDNLEALQELCEGLVDHGIQPYYLHQLDQVQGAQHFEVESQEGLKLVKGLQESLSGYAVPRYVQEIAGRLSKTPLQLID